ncbi:hypothetical protein Glove_78g41 [Diversispora epigaea]|uniref:Uncharacterized protein n=1 Tax=Diversispora epigaea TaxID=1348612 RepID=A0A397J8K6_9GLOM|nr:hypothetical protein Glove_78g41 [Diversispora epigaea]
MLMSFCTFSFIDEYDARVIEAFKNETIIQPHHNHDASVQIKIEKIESSFKSLYCRLKYACDEGMARIFQTGVTLVVMSEFTSGFNISEDLALNKKFWDTYGFKKSEIELLLNKAFGNSLPDNIKEELITWLKNENDGYFFHPKEFLTQHVSCIVLENFWNKRNSLIRDTLLNFPSDPQTLPPLNNSLGKSTVHHQ